VPSVTVFTEGDASFDDGAGNTGTIGYGGVEWMCAGRGVWHGKELGPGRSKGIEGFQLWLALPPELELAEAESQYLEAAAIPEVGPARLILGRYGGRESPVRAPAGVNYLMVTLKPGETWRHETPAGPHRGMAGGFERRADAGRAGGGGRDGHLRRQRRRDRDAIDR
jgi:redox-sensitive bicupin YhaK (pirin superfamily)